MSTSDVVVPSWPVPRGYANGRVGHGEPVHVAGQIGWTADGAFPDLTLLGQFDRALENVLAVVGAAGGAATDIATMTVYVTDIAGYRAIRRELGPVWRARMGTHYPAMALVGVSALVESQALIEISAIAYVERAP